MRQEIFDKIMLNAPSDEQNKNILESWISDVTDKLNYVVNDSGSNQILSGTDYSKAIKDGINTLKKQGLSLDDLGKSLEEFEKALTKQADEQKKQSEEQGKQSEQQTKQQESLNSQQKTIESQAEQITALQKDVSDLQTKLDNYWEVVYPVHSVFISTQNVSPSTFFGGKWSAIAQNLTSMISAYLWERTE